MKDIRTNVCYADIIIIIIVIIISIICFYILYTDALMDIRLNGHIQLSIISIEWELYVTN